MSSSSDQDAVLAFLGDSTRHADVRRIDTHAASVFLFGDRALKIKRAVRLPFLDYSTLALRRAACEKELEVNRPFAPSIYLRVVAITKAANGSLGIDGDGTAIEYAVEMRRFDERNTLDHLAQDGQVDATLAEDLADAIAASHDIATQVPFNAWISCIPGWIDASTASLAASSRFPRVQIEELGGACHAALRRLTPLLEQRIDKGYVRRCHGDLHLANIAMIDGKPMLFDAIEFDDRIATIDLLYDLAFPLMDLLHFGLPVAANHLLNRYLAIAAPDHLDGLSVLPLFMALRAAIRVQVFLAKLDRELADHDDASILPTFRTAESYFQLARQLILPPTPMLIAVGGLSGTGKSALARALAPLLRPRPGAIVLRSDVLRKQLFGVGPTDRLPKEAYSPDSSARVYREMTTCTARVLAQGLTVVVDAVFARPDERQQIRSVAAQQNVPFAGLFLTTDLQTRQKRIAHRINDPSDATEVVAQEQEHYDLGMMDWCHVDASGTPEETLDSSLSLLRINS